MTWQLIGTGVALLMSAALTGCASGHEHATKSTGPAGRQFALYTHCGIDETRIGDAYFIAEQPLGDGENNPPAGWDNPYQRGTITITSVATAVFNDSKHHVVTFRVRPGATEYARICS